MKEQPNIFEIKILNSKRLQLPQQLVYEKFYVHEIAALNLSKNFLKNSKKTSKPNNHDLNRTI